jgi:3-deoxy-D-manno-octulosonic-acid transferase
LHLAKKREAAVAIVNARISDRSFPRYRRFRWFFASVLSQVDLFLAQTEEDARRLREIGAADKRVQVSGNLKFDTRPSSSSGLVEQLRQAIRYGTPVIVCGSTAEGEEELLLEAWQSALSEFPAAVMVLAPRHPERFDKVADLVASMKLTLVRRSAWNDSSAILGNVFLLDTVGELASVYALADVAFVGGSLVPTGGHNILEPAQHGVAIMVGPHTFNFREIVRIFAEGGGIGVVTANDLSRRWLELLQHPEERQRLGQRAHELFVQHTGATQKTLRALAPLLGRKAREVQ